MTLRSITKRRSDKQVVALVPIHPRDARLFLTQLFTEFDRLDWDVAWHINGMPVDHEMSQRIIEHPRTVGYTWDDDLRRPFVDQDRNGIVEIAQRSGAPWISPNDADETYEPRAPELLRDILRQTDKHWVVQWYNVWEVRDGTPIIRVDPPYVGFKARFYPTVGHSYEYRGGVASLYETNGRWPPRGDSGLRIMHWGFQSPESRDWHFKRWDGTNGSHYWTGLVSELDSLQLKPFDPDVPHELFITT